MTTTIPSEQEVLNQVQAIRSSHPDLGLLKVLAALRTQNPSWSVSEKRLRAILQKATPDALTATTALDDTLDIPRIAPKVEARLLKGRGKGLVAKEKVFKGEVLWQEDPWICTADPQLYDILSEGLMCTHCFNIFDTQPISCSNCPARFCNRLCLSRSSSSSHHPLLCPSTNPACVDLLKIIRRDGARHLDAVSRIIALWRIQRETGQEYSNTESRVWRSMARVNIRDKEKQLSNWSLFMESREAKWHEYHKALCHALNPELSSSQYGQFTKALSRFRKGPKVALSETETVQWFSLDSFLDLLGLVSINQESSGGLYALHCHLNHSCEPNIQVRNLPRDFKLPTAFPCDLPTADQPRGTNRLTLLARRDIEPGEELTISYVNFALPRDQRRADLREVYGFWCNCVKCQSMQ